MSHVAAVRPALLAWLEAIRFRDEGWGRWPYHAAMERPWGLISSAWTIGLLDRLGALASVTPAQRAEAIAFLRTCQDPADGMFKDPLVGEAQREGRHSWAQIHGQMSAAETALRRLGGEPVHALPAARFADLRSTDPVAFTRAIDWTNPWGHGESWARAIQCYLRTMGPARRDEALRRLEPAFLVFEREVIDPATGWPSRRMAEADASVAMAGCFKTMMAYLACGRPWPAAERAIDSTLALQHADGEFGFRDNMCINWDSLWVLREMDHQLGGTHRHDAIATAGERHVRRLMEYYWKPAGGFAFHGRHCVVNHHSVRLCREPHPIGDVMGTMMALHCLGYADEWAAGASASAGPELVRGLG